MTDDMLVALARNGGVAQVNFYCGFISQKWVDQSKKLAAEKDPDYEKVQSLFMSRTHAADDASNSTKPKPCWRRSCRARRSATSSTTSTTW